MIDFQKLNPWRKTPTIFKWDDNFRPIPLSAFGPDGTNVEFEIVIPDTFYATIQSITIQLTVTFSLGSSNSQIEIFRGSDLLFGAGFAASTQQQPLVQWFYFNGASITDTSSAGAISRHGLPPNLAVLPGDRIVANVQSNKDEPRDPKMFIYLNAYYF